jgi:hypothetical protein
MQTQQHRLCQLYNAAKRGDQVTVWKILQQAAAYEISLLDLGTEFYLAGDLALDVASHLVFIKGLVQHWTNYKPAQIQVYIKQVVQMFVYESVQKPYKIKQTLACQSTLGEPSFGFRFTTNRLRTLIRTGELFLLFQLFEDAPRSDEIQSLIRYVVSTMTKIMKTAPKHELLQAYLSLIKIKQRTRRGQFQHRRFEYGET